MATAMLFFKNTSAASMTLACAELFKLPSAFTRHWNRSRKARKEETERIGICGEVYLKNELVCTRS
jgi:hypothetical protein